MKPYEGLIEQDLKVIQIAVQKLQITGAEAPMISNLLQKIQMEIELQKQPQTSRPEKGDLITKE
jgi:hypothetical protein